MLILCRMAAQDHQNNIEPELPFITYSGVVPNNNASEDQRVDFGFFDHTRKRIKRAIETFSWIKYKTNPFGDTVILLVTTHGSYDQCNVPDPDARQSRSSTANQTQTFISVPLDEINKRIDVVKINAAPINTSNYCDETNASTIKEQILSMLGIEGLFTEKARDIGEKISTVKNFDKFWLLHNEHKNKPDTYPEHLNNFCLREGHYNRVDFKDHIQLLDKSWRRKPKPYICFWF